MSLGSVSSINISLLSALLLMCIINANPRRIADEMEKEGRHHVDQQREV